MFAKPSTLGPMADSAVIPPPRDDDPEDVFWALSTATTLHQRGDRSEALRWLRRAAEQASDQNADARAVELMKAAADLSATLGSAPAPSAVAAPAARPSTPPPLPKRPASVPAPPLRPSVPPPRPPSVPAPPLKPTVPSARVPAPPAPVKPAARPARERHGTLTGRRARRASSVDLGKIARPPGVPAEIPDTPVDDLDEDTNVYDGKVKGSKGRKPVTPSAPSKPIPAPAPSKPRGLPAPPPSKPTAAPASKSPAAKAEPAARPLEAKVEPIAKASSKAVVTEKEPAPATSKSAPATSKPAVAAAPARAPMLRKGTMQLVDEGFESMLDATEPPAVAVPLFVELPVPPREHAEEPPPPEAPATTQAAPPALAGLLSQRVAVIADENGGARIVALPELASLPEGAVAAILVPLSPADGEPLARMLVAPKS